MTLPRQTGQGVVSQSLGRSCKLPRRGTTCDAHLTPTSYEFVTPYGAQFSLATAPYCTDYEHYLTDKITYDTLLM